MKRNPPRDERIRNLNDKEEEIWKVVTAKPKNHGDKDFDGEIMANITGEKLTRVDFRQLVGTEWLKDKIMCAYVSLINERNEAFFTNINVEEHLRLPYRGRHADIDRRALFQRPRPRTLVHGTRFFERKHLKEGISGPEAVKTWMKKAHFDINHLDLIMAPVNIGQLYWILAGIYIRSKEFFTIDYTGTRHQ